jgi:DNA replication protein DnaC
LGDPQFGKAVACPVCTPPPVPVGVPDDLAGKTFADFDLRRNPEMRPAYEQVKAVAEGREWCALLSGPPGIGKSLLAACALSERWGWFWTWGQLQRRIRRQLFDEGRTEEEAVGVWAEASCLLVLDDLGAEQPRDPTWSNGVLYAIADGRYRRKLPTILTTNNSGVIEDRVLDRYRQGLVVCKGKSQRPGRA